MNQEVTYETLDKKNINKEIEQIQSLMHRIINNDPIFEQVFNDNVDNKESKEMSLKSLKNVLSDLSIKIGYDLEPVKDKISTKHSKLTEISFFILKEAMFEYLHKREKLISTAIFVEEIGEGVLNNNYPTVNTEKSKTKKEVSFTTNNIYKYQQPKSENDMPSDEDPEIQLLILQRSLYILKKKFDLNEKEISYIYNKYSDKNKLDLVIDTNTTYFTELMEDILKVNNFSFHEIQKPSELFRKELMNSISKEDPMSNFSDLPRNILTSLNAFMLKNRKKYNRIIREKREKGKVDLINFSTENEEEENFPDVQMELDTDQDDLLNLIPKEYSDEREQYNTEGAAQNEEKINEDDEAERQQTLPKNENEEDLNNTKNQANPKKERLNTETSQKKIQDTKDSKEMHPNEIENIKNQNEQNEKITENEEENKKIKSLETNLQNEIKSFVKENQTEKTNPKNSLKYNPDNVSDMTINPIIDKDHAEKFKEVMDKIHNQKLNVKKNQSQNRSFLLIEILPLIIADFLHYNQRVVLLFNKEDFQGELRALFDNEILQRLGESVKDQLDEEKTANLKTLLFDKLNLDKNIRIYEDLFVKKKTCRENTVFIEQMLNKLKTQKSWIEGRIKAVQNDTETKIEPKEAMNNLSYNSNQLLNISAVNRSLNMINNSNISAIHNVSKIIPKKYLSKEEIRSSALKEVFYFYSRQHQLAGHLVTFEDIANKTDRMDLGEFMKFCIEFKIQLKKEKLAEIFKKSASNTKQMNCEEFLQSLGTISVKVNEEKKNETIKRINKIKSEIKKKLNTELKSGRSQEKKKNIPEKKKQSKVVINSAENESQLEEKKINPENENNISGKLLDNSADEQNKEKEYNLIPEVNEISEPSPAKQINPTLSGKINNSKISPQLLDDNEILPSYEVTKLKLQIEELKNKSFEALLEELYLYIAIDYEKEYRSKMKGFALPFKTHDKQYRIPNDKLMQRARKVDPRTAEEIKRILKERKEEKVNTKLESERLEKLKLFEQKRQIDKLNKQVAKDRERLIIGKESKYTEIKQKHEIYEKEKETKLTWDALEHMNFNQFISNRDDDFNPKGLIDEYSDDDDLSFLYEENKNGETEDKQHKFLNNGDNSGEEKTNFHNKIVAVNKSNMSTDLDKSLDPPGNYSGHKNSSKSPNDKGQYNKNAKELNNKKYLNEKTEKKAKEMEKEWENKQTQLIHKYDNMVKRSQEKVKSFNNKLGTKIK